MVWILTHNKKGHALNNVSEVERIDPTDQKGKGRSPTSLSNLESVAGETLSVEPSRSPQYI